MMPLNMQLNIPIILLHGLGATPHTLLLLEWTLWLYGWSNISKISYPVDSQTIEQNLEYIDTELQKTFDKTMPIIFIGQSMGGIYAFRIHTLGWNVVYSLSIGSPLNGASFLSQLKDILPAKISDYFYQNKPIPYDYLINKEAEVPPAHSYNTISLGWFNSHFDGCVYKNEAVIDADKNIHLAFADHRTIFANPRLGVVVNELLLENIADVI